MTQQTTTYSKFTRETLEKEKSMKYVQRYLLYYWLWASNWLLRTRCPSNWYTSKSIIESDAINFTFHLNERLGTSKLKWLYTNLMTAMSQHVKTKNILEKISEILHQYTWKSLVVVFKFVLILMAVRLVMSNWILEN